MSVEGNVLTGPPDDDNSYNKQTAAAEIANTTPPPDSSTPTELGTITITADRPKPSTGVGGVVGTRPGKRTYNPLGNFASYTYQISLYMITPDAYGAFTDSGRKNINVLANQDTGGAFLIAQSGGINSPTGNKRAPGFELDFYIDDLKIKNAIQGPDTTTESNTTKLSFNIYEPYGFSFISKLRQASSALQQRSRIKNYTQVSNELKQFYILGIRFQGYDINGNLLSAKDSGIIDTKQPNISSGVFERFYDCVITNMKFTLDGKISTYKIEANSLAPDTAYGVKRGRISNGQNIVASSVEEALNGRGPGIKSLMKVLNQNEQDRYDKQEISRPNEYYVEYIGNADSIKTARLVDVASIDPSRLPMGNATTTAESNESTALKSRNPDFTKRTITFSNDTSILQAISDIIKQSTYLSDAMKILKDTSLDSNTGSDAEKQEKNPARIKWYNLSSRVECLEWDTKRNDFAYKITYVIQPYETPAAISPYIHKTSNYYGPHKIYDYWFTGKNTEVISYEQVLNNAYYMVALDPSNDPASHGGEIDVSQVTDRHDNQPRQGAPDVGLGPQNSYLTSLFDPKGFAEAKVSIMGDPDYLMSDSSGSLNQVYSQFYGPDGFTINANGGQVFIQINFKEGVDYKNEDGLMSINESLLFWKYPKSVKNVKGIHYLLISVDSDFSRGKFTQQLKGRIYTFPGAEQDDQKAGATRENNTRDALNSSDVRQSTSQAGTTATTNANGSTDGVTGLLPDELAGLDPNIASQQAENQIALNRSDPPMNSITSPTGGSNNVSAPPGLGGEATNSSAGAQINGGQFVVKNVADDDASTGTTNVTPSAQGGREEEPPGIAPINNRDLSIGLGP
jgi:hypothetical protein